MNLFINNLNFPLYYQIPPSLSSPNFENNIMKYLYYFTKKINNNFILEIDSILIINILNNDIYELLKIIPHITNELLFPENNNMYCHPKLYNIIINEIKEIIHEKYSCHFNTIFYHYSKSHFLTSI